MTRTPIEQQCQSLSRVLHAEAADEIQLLRSARRLKRVHEELGQSALRRVYGSQPEAILVREALEVVERELRVVLLNHHALSRKQIREHVLIAFRHSMRALRLLEGPGEVS
jgi:hypothetical protein